MHKMIRTKAFIYLMPVSHLDVFPRTFPEILKELSFCQSPTLSPQWQRTCSFTNMVIVFNLAGI